MDEIAAFAMFSSLLVRKNRNRGEASVLALASVVGCIAVVDDGAGRKAAKTYKVECRPTAALLCEAIRQGLLTTRLVSLMFDDFLADLYRLPFKKGEFEPWADENGLLD